jgi:hypothetical protein
MKKYIALCVLTIIVFGTLTLLTAKIETAFDGNDNYGFPFEFYKIYGGKRTYYPPNEFSIIKLTIDIIIAAFISFGIITIIKIFRPTKKSGL